MAKEGSPEVLAKRRMASRKHGAFAKNLTEADLMRYADIHSTLQDNDDVVRALRHRATLALLRAEQIDAYIGQQVEAGKVITDLPILNKYNSFAAEARRTLVALLKHLPPERQNVVEAELKKIDEVIDEHTQTDGDKA